jgi:hypothetical protein
MWSNRFEINFNQMKSEHQERGMSASSCITIFSAETYKKKGVFIQNRAIEVP